MNVQQQPFTQQPIMGDIIEQLPSDQTIPSHNEIRIVDTLFKEQKSIIDTILMNTKDLIVLGILFIIFSLPQVDALIEQFFNSTSTSPYILIGVKTLLFIISYFILQNLHLVKK